MVGVFRRRGGAVLVCVVVLREGGERMVRYNIEELRYPRAESMTSNDGRANSARAERYARLRFECRRGMILARDRQCQRHGDLALRI